MEEWALAKKRIIALRSGQFHRRIFHTPIVKYFIPGSRTNVVPYGPLHGSRGNRKKRRRGSMRFVRSESMFCAAMLLLVAGTAHSAWDGPMAASQGKDFGQSAGLSAGIEGDDSVQTAICPDIAYTEQFRSRGQEYVHTREFAESVVAVANGTSSHSPPEILKEWKWPVAADGWKTHFAAHEEYVRVIVPGTAHPDSHVEEVVKTAIHHKAGPGTPDALSREREGFRLERDSCSPALLFLASLDYRDKTGRRDLPLLFPWNVRLATMNLNTSILAAFERIEAETDAGGSLPPPAEGSVREQGSGDTRRAAASTR